MLSATKAVGASSGRPMILVWNAKVMRIERMGSWSARTLNAVPRVKRHRCHLQNDSAVSEFGARESVGKEGADVLDFVSP